ncbi:type IV pilus twitching motility protein PilT [Candidatus Pantoea floridensis]|uniref:Twitching motility protein PilT n=1 Tax=Candidatus Pantoea floridensis TaxID=1938870 RepID=A0A286BVI7_9GAMM|nr:type IV pilus twitching motility protein PilT [Pantoea floridensis]PIF14063.1 twitching motility protein PilT [Enterobacteriaceae bacterium JKS000233]SOD38161.1 twitching motility protein PilT [Pantoea floridensis]
MELDEMVALSVKHNAADLHLCSGHLPHWRRQGVLEPIPQQSELAGGWLESVMQQWLTAPQQAELEENGHVDFAMTLTSGVRLRANLFMQRHGLSLALRLIASSAPDLNSLHLPEVVSQLLQLEEGLILITGATGSGKSTTLAAMVDSLNRQQARHILTLEDPVEFVHHSQRSLIQQREVGAHCASFQHGLKAALREDPDVILLGELRDSETIRLALTAAETGHLVLATLHTRGATQAVDRLVDVFPAEEKNLVRTQLAGSLKAVLAQRLVPAKAGGRIGLFEVLVATPAVANLIREGKMHQLPGVLQTGAQAGMQTFAQSEQARQQAGMI